MTDVNTRLSDTSEQSAAAASPFLTSELFKTATNARGFYANYVLTLLEIAAYQLQNQADYLHKLSTVTQPAEAFGCHAEFMHRLLTGWTKTRHRFAAGESLHQTGDVESASSPVTH